jgi:hypothetical protein
MGRAPIGVRRELARRVCGTWRVVPRLSTSQALRAAIPVRADPAPERGNDTPRRGCLSSQRGRTPLFGRGASSGAHGCVIESLEGSFQRSSWALRPGAPRPPPTPPNKPRPVASAEVTVRTMPVANARSQLPCHLSNGRRRAARCERVLRPGRVSSSRMNWRRHRRRRDDRRPAAESLPNHRSRLRDRFVSHRCAHVDAHGDGTDGRKASTSLQVLVTSCEICGG